MEKIKIDVERRREKGLTLMLSNKFEVLTSRVMNVGILSGSKVRKKRKMILREEKLKEEKKEKSVEVKKDRRRKIVERGNCQNKIEAERGGRNHYEGVTG